MVYEYKCSKGHLTDHVQSIQDPVPKEIVCEVCGESAPRSWGTTQVFIPEHFRATSEYYNSDSLADPSVLNNRLKHSRPSGKEKIYW